MSLANVIRRHIADVYPGRGGQRDFAEALGVPQKQVSNWVTGRAKLPEPETRRLLARALGLRHIDLFVLAGELDPDEVPGYRETVEQPTIRPGSIEAELVRVLAELTPESRQVVLHVAREFLARKRELEGQEGQPPAPNDLSATGG